MSKFDHFRKFKVKIMQSNWLLLYDVVVIRNKVLLPQALETLADLAILFSPFCFLSDISWFGYPV
jgi:hypothetical protein